MLIASEADRLAISFCTAYCVPARLEIHAYAGDERALGCARQLADWNISHSTPADWLYGSLPYSTFSNGVAGGFVDGDAIMTDKPAIMGLAYLRLYRTTGARSYLEAAERIAATLAANQRDAGNWPFRVNPKTGEVREDYTSSAIYGVMLFEAVDAALARPRFEDHRRRALAWVLENPVRSMDWRGFYTAARNDRSH